MKTNSEVPIPQGRTVDRRMHGTTRKVERLNSGIMVEDSGNLVLSTETLANSVSGIKDLRVDEAVHEARLSGDKHKSQLAANKFTRASYGRNQAMRKREAAVSTEKQSTNEDKPVEKQGKLF